MRAEEDERPRGTAAEALVRAEEDERLPGVAAEAPVRVEEDAGHPGGEVPPPLLDAPARVAAGRRAGAGRTLAPRDRLGAAHA